MSQPVTFWFEFASTYSYPAAMRLEALAVTHGVEVIWRPFLLGPIFAGEGFKDSPFNLQPTKGRYMWRDLARICDRLGLGFVRPDPFPQNGLLGARVATALPDRLRPGFVRALYTAEFARGETISDPAVVRAALVESGCDADVTLALATSEDVKAQLRASTEAAKAAGIFGAPSFTVAGELFWGNDRLEEALAWAVKT